MYRLVQRRANWRRGWTAKRIHDGVRELPVMPLESCSAGLKLRPIRHPARQRTPLDLIRSVTNAATLECTSQALHSS